MPKATVETLVKKVKALKEKAVDAGTKAGEDEKARPGARLARKKVKRAERHLRKTKGRIAQLEKQMKGKKGEGAEKTSGVTVRRPTEPSRR